MLQTLGVVLFPHREPGRQGGSSAVSLAHRKIGGQQLLEWVIRRVTESQRLDGVIAVVGNGVEDTLVADQVPLDVPVYRGDHPDPLARVAGALREFSARSVVLVSADNPFVDPVLLDRLVSTACDNPGVDYVSYRSGDGRPAIQSRLGLFAEWCTSAALRVADREASHARDRSKVTPYVYSHPERFTLRLLPMPVELDRQDVRLTIDVEEDWEHAEAIFDALGPESLDWQGIAGLLEQQPALRQRMALLNREAAGR